MDFTLTAEQEMLRDTARQLFDQECSSTFVRAAWADPVAARPLWERHLAGWMDLAAGDLVDLVLFATEHGRAVAPGVFFGSLLAAQVAAAGGVELSGSAAVAVAGVDGVWRPNDEPVATHVLEADEVDQLVVVGGSPEAPWLRVVDAAGVDRREVAELDRLRRGFEVDVSTVPAGDAVDPDAWRHAVERCLVIVAAESIGVARWLLDTSVAYAKERVQFDRPIGSFQGLQWKLVDCALELERAAAAVSYAAMCVDANDADRHRAVHGAKAEAGLAARRCARDGLQSHGGIGYTWEHDLHLRLRRAFTNDALMAPSGWHLDRLAELLFG
jgi:alkylation response protein AidB-like acyl-CoA dehydrogenase